jgi:hypothetical protein
VQKRECRRWGCKKRSRKAQRRSKREVEERQAKRRGRRTNLNDDGRIARDSAQTRTASNPWTYSDPAAASSKS